MAFSVAFRIWQQQHFQNSSIRRGFLIVSNLNLFYVYPNFGLCSTSAQNWIVEICLTDLSKARLHCHYCACCTMCSIDTLWPKPYFKQSTCILFDRLCELQVIRYARSLLRFRRSGNTACIHSSQIQSLEDLYSPSSRQVVPHTSACYNACHS